MWRRLAAGPKSVCFSKGYVRLFFVIAFLERSPKMPSRPSNESSCGVSGDQNGMSPPQSRPKMGSKSPLFEMLVTDFAPPYLTIRLLGQIRATNRQIGKFGAEGSFELRGFGFELRDGSVLGTDVGLGLVSAGVGLVSAGYARLKSQHIG